MKTEITELLGIKYPIIQGGMAWVADFHLAAAVSNAGGLGIIGAGGAPAQWVREQILEAKKLTDKPFGVNIMLMNPEADEIAKILIEEGVKVVTTGAGNPAKYIKSKSDDIPKIKEKMLNIDNSFLSFIVLISSLYPFSSKAL